MFYHLQVHKTINRFEIESQWLVAFDNKNDVKTMYSNFAHIYIHVLFRINDSNYRSDLNHLKSSRLT